MAAAQPLLSPPATVSAPLTAGGNGIEVEGLVRDFKGGVRAVDGIDVLVAQGALSFRLWTGRDAPIQTMREAARAADPASQAPAPAPRR